MSDLRHTVARGARIWLTMLLGAGAWLIALPARAQDQGAREHTIEARVALIAVTVSEGLRAAHGDIAVQAERGLQAAGLSLLPLAETLATPGSAGDSCGDVACMRAIADRLAATHLARVNVDSSSEGFTIRVRVVRARDGAHLADESLTCAATDPCAPVPQSAGEVAREAGRKARLELQRAPIAAPVPRFTPDPVPALPGPAASTPNSSDVWASPWPWVAGGAVAAAAIGVGVYYFAIDGDETDCDASVCQSLHDTGGAAIAWTVAGGTLAAASLVGYFVFAPDGAADAPAVAVAVGPGTINITGRF